MEETSNVVTVSRHLAKYTPFDDYRGFIKMDNGCFAEVNLHWADSFVGDLCAEFCEIIIRKKEDISKNLHTTFLDGMIEFSNSVDNFIGSLGGHIEIELATKLYGHYLALRQAGKEVPENMEELLGHVNKQRIRPDGTYEQPQEIRELPNEEFLDLLRKIRDQLKPRNKYRNDNELLNDALLDNKVLPMEAAEAYIKKRAFEWYIDWHEQMDENCSESIKRGLEAYDYSDNEVERMERLIAIHKKYRERFPKPDEPTLQR